MWASEGGSWFLKVLGLAIILLSAFVISLGLVNVTLSYQATCNILNMCGMTTSGYAFSWVSVPIWAPIPVFINGVIAVWLSSQKIFKISWFTLLCFVNTVIFAPAVVVVTSLEVYNKFPNGLPQIPRSYATPMFAFELLICIIGGIDFILMALLFLVTWLMPATFERFKNVARKKLFQPAQTRPYYYEVDRTVGVPAANPCTTDGNSRAVFFANANYNKRQILNFGSTPMVASRW